MKNELNTLGEKPFETIKGGFQTPSLRRTVNVRSDSSIHDLKLREEFQSSIENGIKTFEIRKEDDKKFKEDDLIIFKVIDKSGKLTGKIISVQIIYVLRDPEFCKEGFATLGINYLKTTDMFVY